MIDYAQFIQFLIAQFLLAITWEIYLKKVFLGKSLYQSNKETMGEGLFSAGSIIMITCKMWTYIGVYFLLRNWFL